MSENIFAWGAAIIDAKSVLGNVSRGRVAFAEGKASTAAAGFLPGTKAFVTGGRAVIAATGRPHRSRARFTVTGRLGKGEIAKNHPTVTSVTCESPAGSGTFPIGARAVITTRSAPRTAVYAPQGRAAIAVEFSSEISPFLKENKTAVEQPNQSLEKDIPFGYEMFAIGGEAAAAARLVPWAAIRASREKAADAVELPSRSSATVARKAVAVAPLL